MLVKSNEYIWAPLTNIYELDHLNEQRSLWGRVQTFPAKYNKPKINATYPWKMKKKFQEKKMLVIVDNHIEWDKTNRSGVHFSNVLRTLTLGIRQ